MNPDATKWVDLAGYDLATAEAMLASGRYLYVLFCSQQAIEKRIKARLVEQTGEFPRALMISSNSVNPQS